MNEFIKNIMNNDTHCKICNEIIHTHYDYKYDTIVSCDKECTKIFDSNIRVVLDNEFYYSSFIFNTLNNKTTFILFTCDKNITTKRIHKSFNDFNIMNYNKEKLESFINNYLLLS